MSEQEKRETLFEAKILEVLNHPNIVRFREVYKTKKGKLCIVMDYADGGDLQTLIKSRAKAKKYLTESEVLDYFT
jgi:NIMA (never in mitosis gene a)-related kinase 1/4/5